MYVGPHCSYTIVLLVPSTTNMVYHHFEQVKKFTNLCKIHTWSVCLKNSLKLVTERFPRFGPLKGHI